MNADTKRIPYTKKVRVCKGKDDSGKVCTLNVIPVNEDVAVARFVDRDGKTQSPMEGWRMSKIEGDALKIIELFLDSWWLSRDADYELIMTYGTKENDALTFLRLCAKPTTEHEAFNVVCHGR